jgi:hypothetical protein
MENKIGHFKLSDHHPQFLRISDALSIMTWNILKKCVFHEQPQKFYNNGFGIIETESEYHIRLKKIAHEIHDILVSKGTIKCIALQEIPVDSDLEFFKKCLSEVLPNFELVTTQTQGFLFDRIHVNIQDTTADLLRKIGKSPHKIQSIRAIINNNEIYFINVHLCWFKSNHSRLSAIHTIIKTLNKRIIILGDFNFNILDTEIPGTKKYSEPDTTLCYAGNGIQNLQTCDGFMIYDR